MIDGISIIVYLISESEHNGGKDMVELMTDRQYDGILQMIEMIVDGCKDIEEAKRKIAELRKDRKEKAE